MKSKFPKIKKLLQIKCQSYYFSISLVPEKTYRNECLSHGRKNTNFYKFEQKSVFSQ